MVPHGGTSSNSDIDLLTHWERGNKAKESPEAPAPAIEATQELFEALADWNEHLERHVPFFKEAGYDL